ncbi:hypothetical protein [Acinetobacter modestus]|nr:hypothetical protein [Acinetobacter modestus]
MAVPTIMEAAWMPPVKLWYQGCTISLTSAFAYFGRNQSKSS